MWLRGIFSKLCGARTHLGFVSYFWNTFSGAMDQTGIEKLALIFYQYLQLKYHAFCEGLDHWIVPLLIAKAADFGGS